MASQQDTDSMFGYQFAHTDDQPAPLEFDTMALGSHSTEILDEHDRQETDAFFASIRGDDFSTVPQYSEAWMMNQRPQSLVGVSTSLAHSQADHMAHTSSMASGMLPMLGSASFDHAFGSSLGSAESLVGNYQIHGEPGGGILSTSTASTGYHDSGFLVSPHLSLPNHPIPLSSPPIADPSFLQHLAQAQPHPHPNAVLEAASSLTSLNQFSHTPHSQTAQHTAQALPSGQAPEEYATNFAVMSGARDTVPGHQPRPHARHENLQFGSDEQFVNSPHFVPRHSRETSQALAEKQGTVVQHALQRIPSAATTRQSSPVPGVVSPTAVTSPTKVHSKLSASTSLPPTAPSVLKLVTSNTHIAEERPAKRLKSPPPEDDLEPGTITTDGLRETTTSPSKAGGGAGGSKRRARTRQQEKPKRTPLTAEQKRLNHNESEKRRRLFITKGFEDLRVARPGVHAKAESKAELVKDTARWLSILVENNEFLRDLVEKHGCASQGVS